jgi:Phosphotransferase system, mannose/fructose-specific component IIA
VIGIVVVAHTPLASAVVNCACHVLGDVPALAVLDVDADVQPEPAAKALAARIAEVDSGNGVLVLTDIKGATPSNIAHKACEQARQAGVACELLAGLNAPMLLRALNYRQRTLAEVRECALVGGAQGVIRVD